MQLDRDDLARKIKTHVGGATRDEQSTTIQTLCEYIIRESIFSLLDMIEPAITKASEQNDNMDALEERLELLEGHNKFLMSLIGFKKDMLHGEDGGYENAQRSTKAPRQKS